MNTLEQKVLKLEDRVKALEEKLNASSEVVTKSNKQLSPKEFLLGKKITTETQKALALVYYLERYQSMESFNVSDLVDIFSLAKEKPPKNPNDVVNKNIAQGFIFEVKEKKDNKKAWTLTATGEKFVENELSNV